MAFLPFGLSAEALARNLKLSLPVCLPPYAPELNPMEKVWDYLRGNKLSGFVCNTYKALRDARKEAWNFIAKDPERIASIGTRHWARGF